MYSSCVDVTQPHTVRVCVRPCPLWWARVISLPSRQTSLTLARKRLYTVYIAQLGGLRKSCKQLLTRQKVVLFHLTYIMFFSLMKDYLHVWQFFGDHLLFYLFCTSSGINVYYYYIIITILLLLYYYYYIIITFQSWAHTTNVATLKHSSFKAKLLFSNFRMSPKHNMYVFAFFETLKNCLNPSSVIFLQVNKGL